MIELQLPADAPYTALEDVRRAISAHLDPAGEAIALTSGERRVELGDRYRVDGSVECLAALMGALDAVA